MQPQSQPMRNPDNWRNRFAQHRFLGQITPHRSGPYSQFVLYGQVDDRYYYGEHGWYFLGMRETLSRALQAAGYEVVMLFSLTGGLTYATPSMYARHWSIFQPHRNEANLKPPDRPPPPERNRFVAVQTMNQLLRQEVRTDHVVPAAVIIERSQYLFTQPSNQEDYQIADFVQSWSDLTNGNIVIYVVDTKHLAGLPEILSARRAGVRHIEVGPATSDEVDQLLISAWLGRIARDFHEPNPLTTASVVVPPLLRREMMRSLVGQPLRVVRSYLDTCVRRGFSNLTPRVLSLVASNSRDIWPDLLKASEIERLQVALNERVIGQNHVVDKFIEQLRAISQILQSPNRIGRDMRKPLGIFFFVGPTGVGKTEIFRVLKDTLSGISTLLISMTEYSESNSGNRLFGPPPGYVGYEQGGELTNFLLANPTAIVLFDEFEKAHAEVWRIFITLVEGNLTSGSGEKVDLSQCLLIFTSNAGAEALAQLPADLSTVERDEISRHLVRQALTDQRPLDRQAPIELLNRLFVGLYTFTALGESQMRRIINRQLKQLEDTFAIHFDQSVIAWLLDRYDPRFGARLMVERHIQTELHGVIASRHGAGDMIYIDPEQQIRWALQAAFSAPTYRRLEERPTG